MTAVPHSWAPVAEYRRGLHGGCSRLDRSAWRLQEHAERPEPQQRDIRPPRHLSETRRSPGTQDRSNHQRHRSRCPGSTSHGAIRESPGDSGLGCERPPGIQGRSDPNRDCATRASLSRAWPCGVCLRDRASPCTRLRASQTGSRGYRRGPREQPIRADREPAPTRPQNSSAPTASSATSMRRPGARPMTTTPAAARARVAARGALGSQEDGTGRATSGAGSSMNMALMGRM